MQSFRHVGFFGTQGWTLDTLNKIMEPGRMWIGISAIVGSSKVRRRATFMVPSKH
jgi:hypothetical protein